MYVCICKNVTDSQIRAAVLDGRVAHLRHLRQTFDGACGECGLCCRDAAEIIQDARAEQQTQFANRYRPAA